MNCQRQFSAELDPFLQDDIELYYYIVWPRRTGSARHKLLGKNAVRRTEIRHLPSVFFRAVNHYIDPGHCMGYALSQNSQDLCGNRKYVHYAIDMNVVAPRLDYVD